MTKEVAADRGSSSSECVEVPRESLSAVCRALDWHPTSRTLLTQALLAAASLCAAGEYTLPAVHVLMRDEKEGRKKQARSNEQHMYMCIYDSVHDGETMDPAYVIRSVWVQILSRHISVF